MPRPDCLAPKRPASGSRWGSSAWEYTASAGIVDLGVEAGEIVRLHELYLTVASQGTVTIGYDDDGAGTNAVVLSGPMLLGASAGIPMRYVADPRSALKTPAGKHLTLTFTSLSGAGGHAFISKGLV